MAPTTNTNGNGSNGSNGSMVKVPWSTLLTILSWIVVVAMSFSMLETKEHAEKTYIRKDVFEVFANTNGREMQEIKDILKQINAKLDAKQDKNERKQ
jgi:hypothetical protein